MITSQIIVLAAHLNDVFCVRIITQVRQKQGSCSLKQQTPPTEPGILPIVYSSQMRLDFHHNRISWNLYPNAATFSGSYELAYTVNYQFSSWLLPCKDIT